MAAMSSGWLMLFTMEFMLRGEPVGWLAPPSPGKDRLLGEDPPVGTAAMELRFLLPRFLPSWELGEWEEEPP